MANFVFNVSAGHISEYAVRVNGNDPTNSVFYVHAWVTTEADATLKDLDDVSLVQGNANTAEATNTNYAEKTITSLTRTVDDANDQVEIDMADQTWTGVVAGDNWTDLSCDYDSDSTSGTDLDSAVVPMTWHDFSVTPDGSDITVQWNAEGIFKAQAQTA